MNPDIQLSTEAQRRHAEGMARLTASYQAIEPGRTVRLAKRTSNLFRTRELTGNGLDVSGLTGVLAVDPERKLAVVQGMCTYEDLVTATLEHDLMPLVVPQLRTITLGGAVTGLGIESTSFRNGLPHESVLEMDILTGDGTVVTATPDGEHADLFAAFPNSYGSLGYATRLVIELERIGTHVTTRNVRFDTITAALAAVAEIVESRSYDGEPVDALDGVVFAEDEVVLVLAHVDQAPGPVSDYTGDRIFYRSVRERATDRLTAHDYLWRWDTDWFWCSEAFGAQHPVIRRLWPQRWRRSDAYHRIVRLENKYRVAARIDRARGLPDRERVVQDVELPLDRTADFLTWFLEHVPMRPIWLCPLRLREPDGPGSARTWPLYAMEAGTTYVNLGFWGTVPIEPGRADGDVNKAIEATVGELGGHKSLYSDAFYDRETFDRLYGGAAYREVKAAYDPGRRFADHYDKAVGR